MAEVTADNFGREVVKALGKMALGGIAGGVVAELFGGAAGEVAAGVAVGVTLVAAVPDIYQRLRYGRSRMRGLDN